MITGISILDFLMFESVMFILLLGWYIFYRLNKKIDLLKVEDKNA
jgi:hypothetical protein